MRENGIEKADDIIARTTPEYYSQQGFDSTRVEYFIQKADELKKIEAKALFTYPNYSAESKESRGMLDISESTLNEMSSHTFGLEGIPYYVDKEPRKNVSISQYQFGGLRRIYTEQLVF